MNIKINLAYDKLLRNIFYLKKINYLTMNIKNINLYYGIRFSLVDSYRDKIADY